MENVSPYRNEEAEPEAMAGVAANLPSKPAAELSPSGASPRPGTSISDAFFTCFICYSTVRKPRLCPKCAHLCCHECLKRWYSMSTIATNGSPPRAKKECPHCRYVLSMEHYVKCPWVEELVQKIQEEQRNTSDRCDLHQEQKTVYCHTCAHCICSVCALFSGHHNEHSFRPVEEIYCSKVTVIQSEIDKLHNRVACLEAKRKLLDKGARRVRLAKEDSLRDAQGVFQAMERDIAKQMTEKLVEIHGDRGVVVFELEIVSQALKNLQELIKRSPKSELIMKTGALLCETKEINAREDIVVEPFQRIQFRSSVVPDYTGDTFEIRDFTTTAESTDPVFSQCVPVGGLKWRLKVYPNYKPTGSTDAATFLSVFLELTDGPSGSHYHEYRIELVHLGTLADGSDKNPEQNICKEFTSNFEVGECWGSNRFYEKDALAADGFLTNGVLILKFEVRPPNFAKAYQYAEWYIKKLEAAKTSLEEENKQLKNTAESPSEVLPLAKCRPEAPVSVNLTLKRSISHGTNQAAESDSMQHHNSSMWQYPSHNKHNFTMPGIFSPLNTTLLEKLDDCHLDSGRRSPATTPALNYDERSQSFVGSRPNTTRRAEADQNPTSPNEVSESIWISDVPENVHRLTAHNRTSLERTPAWVFVNSTTESASEAMYLTEDESDTAS